MSDKTTATVVTDAELEKSAAELVDKAFAEVNTDSEDNISKAGQGGDTNSEKMDGFKTDADAKKERPSEAVGGKDVIKAKKAKEKKEDGAEVLEKEDMSKMYTQKSIEVSPEDFEILVKAKAEQEELRKSEEKESFKKSVSAIVQEELGGIREQLDSVVKALSKPVERKSIDKIEVVEKSFAGNNHSDETSELSKAEVLDEMEELAKSGKISTNSVIEYESCGTVSNRHDYEAVMKSLSSK